MRTRVRVIFSLWLALGVSLTAGIAYQFLPSDLMFWFVLALLIIELAAFFAIWRTQPTFRKLMHWASGGLWPREGGES